MYEFYFSLQSFHAEVHQYKSHMDDLNHLTRDLISTYQDDDTAAIKKMTESVNQRWGTIFRICNKV